jgi:sulfite exporter TauE/SafE
MLARQLVYTAGRIFTYAFLGAVGGFAGMRLSAVSTSIIGAQQALSLLAGVLMVLIGLQVLGLAPVRAAGGGALGRMFTTIFSHFLNARGVWGHFSAGVANGFLPCGLVYAFLATAVASGSIHRGFLIMVVFGIGTAPAMLLVGCGGGIMGRAARQRVLRLAAACMIFMGGMTIYRAWPSGESGCCQHAV